MINFFWAIGASIVISLVSLIGIFTFLFKDKVIDKILFLLIGFSAGALIAGAFLHLLPEAVEKYPGTNIFLYVILGFILFFILEKFLYWRHCHNGVCDIHPFTYLNLIGDGIHNFIDGLIIGASFVVSVKFGILTSLVVVFHEIPQEIGDFGVLVYGGIKKEKALFYNFISALACIFGAMAGFALSEKLDILMYLLPITAGGFIYIAACDLVPEIHKEMDSKRSISSAIAFLCGILFIMLSRMLDQH